MLRTKGACQIAQLFVCPYLVDMRICRLSLHTALTSSPPPNILLNRASNHCITWYCLLFGRKRFYSTGSWENRCTCRLAMLSQLPSYTLNIALTQRYLKKSYLFLFQNLHFRRTIVCCMYSFNNSWSRIGGQHLNISKRAVFSRYEVQNNNTKNI